MLSICCGAPAFLLLAISGRPDQGLVAALSISIMVLVVRTSWKLRSRPWFWLVVGGFAVAHAILVLLTHFPRVHFVLLICIPAAFIDFSVMIASFWFLERWNERRAGRK